MFWLRTMVMLGLLSEWSIQIGASSRPLNVIYEKICKNNRENLNFRGKKMKFCPRDMYQSNHWVGKSIFIYRLNLYEWQICLIYCETRHNAVIWKKKPEMLSRIVNLDFCIMAKWKINSNLRNSWLLQSYVGPTCGDHLGIASSYLINENTY